MCSRKQIRIRILFVKVDFLLFCSIFLKLYRACYSLHFNSTSIVLLPQSNNTNEQFSFRVKYIHRKVHSTANKIIDYSLTVLQSVCCSPVVQNQSNLCHRIHPSTLI